MIGMLRADIAKYDVIYQARRNKIVASFYFKDIFRGRGAMSWNAFIFKHFTKVNKQMYI